MRKPIISGAVVILLAVVGSFAAEGARMKITSSAFQEGGNIPSKFTCERIGHQPTFADNRCSFESEKSCFDCR